MLNKLQAMIRQYDMLQPGDRVICAVSGGADSVALLFAMYLLRQKLQITVCAAHFNHRLRGAESDRDEEFVRQLCAGYDIELYVGSGQVVSGKKGLEAAARDARYAFLRTIPGKLVTAHTANDNAETMLMRMIRGTGLKGLGAIAPVSGNLIRPMLNITRQEVLAFLEEYHLSYVSDSSNDDDCFLRNRLRHRIMPLLEQENPKIAENLSAMALRLRQDEEALSEAACTECLPDVPALRQMSTSLRRRAIAVFLERCGVREPESEHIALTERLIFSDKPSARADLPGGVVICRCYDRLEKGGEDVQIQKMLLPCPGMVDLPQLGLQITCAPAEQLSDETNCFTVSPVGEIYLRGRLQGDSLRLTGGRKSLKRLFIDKKIPASHRMQIPVLADAGGILGVVGFGADKARLAVELPAVEIRVTAKNTDRKLQEDPQ